jgi:hypothetical protein
MSDVIFLCGAVKKFNISLAGILIFKAAIFYKNNIPDFFIPTTKALNTKDKGKTSHSSE